MSRYRYFMSGSFTPGNKKFLTHHPVLGIEIPSPYTHITKEAALDDQRFVYRFVVRDDGEIVIRVYPGQVLVSDDNGAEGSAVPYVTGESIHEYSYDEFVRAGGIIFDMPEWAKCRSTNLEDMQRWVEDTVGMIYKAQDYSIQVTFRELFPSLRPGNKSIYIDDEAYYIAEIAEP